jgi:hypothetical protein
MAKFIPPAMRVPVGVMPQALITAIEASLPGCAPASITSRPSRSKPA